MNDFARLILLLVLAGAALTVLGGAAIWFMEEERRIRRAFRNVLGARAEAVVVAKGRGRAAGFCFSRGAMAVAWDFGAWCLVYRVEELMGAELVVDGEVVGRAYRGEPRRALDQVASDASQVTLRLVFDDPKHPDFDLDLWLAGDEARRGAGKPAAAVQEANRWLARAEAILRRPAARRSAPVIGQAAQLTPAAAKTTAATALAPDLEADLEDDDEDEEAPF